MFVSWKSFAGQLAMGFCLGVVSFFFAFEFAVLKIAGLHELLVFLNMEKLSYYFMSRSQV